MESTLAMFREELQELVHFQTLRSSTITPYVDTKDREVAGLMHGLSARLRGEVAAYALGTLAGRSRFWLSAAWLAGAVIIGDGLLDWMMALGLG